MPLLGRDHLVRGRGPVKLFNKAFFTAADFLVIVVSAFLLFTQHGPNLTSLIFGDDDDRLLMEPLAAVRPLQAYILLGGICMYFFKVFYWTWTYSHSNTVSVGSALFVAFGYHLFVALSICLAAYKANRMPTMWEIIVGSVFCVTALVHETLADRELAEFKKNKTKGELLTYGYHSFCRHPNYFFNTFPFPCVGLMSGSHLVFVMWFAIQVFWVHTQSGPALEQYMASNYGKAWEQYSKSVPFFFPGMDVLMDILSFKYVGAMTSKGK